MVEEQGQGKPTAAKADMIAHATKRAITERLDEDPAFYEKFSKLIQQAIDDYRAGRMSDLEYLNRPAPSRMRGSNRKTDDVPNILRGKLAMRLPVSASWSPISVATLRMPRRRGPLRQRRRSASGPSLNATKSWDSGTTWMRSAGR